MFKKWNYGPTPLADYKTYVDEIVGDGFNAMKVHLPWAKVVSRNGTVDYTLFDQQVDYILSKGLRCAIGIDLLRNFADGQDALLSANDLMVDPAGRVNIWPANQDLSQFAPSSQTAVARAAEFVSEATDRYHQRAGDGIVFYETTLSQYAETEYWNGVYDPQTNTYVAGHYDYSAPAVSRFRDNLKTKYSSIGDLNSAWGTTYSSFADVQAPTDFAGQAGKDWYLYRHDMLATAVESLSTAIHDVSGTLRHSVRFGSTYDSLAPWRGTVLFPQLSQHADAVHVDDAPTYNHPFAMDLLGSSLPSCTWTGNEIDGPGSADDATYLKQAAESFAHGATVLCVANWGNLATLQARRSLFQTIAAEYLNAKPIALDPGLEVPVSAQELLATGSKPDQSTYDSLSGTGVKRIKVPLVDDLTRT
ncbi:beta-galactosidase [Streptomyces scopuliridis]|uniref:beta-galactosidase n=1 Tax=Streptomyces scopuliridis TaxID=452529 RepID=UPI0036878A0B